MLNSQGKCISPRKNQQGFAMIIVAIGGLAMVGMVGLALDFAHVATNRARLQNSLDAAALAAASNLKATLTHAQAIEAGSVAYRNNINAGENWELVSGGADENDLTFEFSNTVKPFVPDAAATNFVRVRMNSDISFATWFMSVFGQNNLNFNSSAVAGITPVIGQSCNLAPFIVCGDPTQENYGYPVGTTMPIKLGSNESDIGPGNFQLAQLDEAGKDAVRKALAGGNEYCYSVGESVDSETGNAIGPVGQGLNTRFNEYGANLEAADYPPDLVVNEPMSYADYQTAYSDENWSGGLEAPGQKNRRIMSAPIADCSAGYTGKSTLPTYPDVLCIFLPQKAPTTGVDGNVWVEVIEGCHVNGVPGPDPGDSKGPRTIQLYGDPDRWDT